MKKLMVAISFFISASAIAGPHYVSGKIQKVSGSVDPAIQMTNAISPEKCNAGNYGWLRFKGTTSEERHRVYATALSAAIANKQVTVYTNSDDAECRIYAIEVNM
ncbi:hypothetical protein [Aliikangiella coralliicola]|uniref:Uncharacterized protein n=1 Tax=Aliikangiella coralliicola TaxID=2592383 RepID=A0A545UJR5_9GAMM|nr:hypothetical protein [Aliikangiella coralliicola]TQV89707.1 hypothetical protein FLL46_02155 [Aliikangiella coralliicola]